MTVENLTRITFTNGEGKEEIEFQEATLEISNVATITVTPPSYTKNNVKDWMVVASNDEGVQYSGEVVHVTEQMYGFRPVMHYECLPAVHYDNQLYP